MNAADLCAMLKQGAVIREHARNSGFKHWRYKVTLPGGEVLPTQASTVRAMLMQADFTIIIRENLLAQHSDYMALPYEDDTDPRWIVRRFLQPKDHSLLEVS